ncbi:carbon-nitrogen hydrolase family protein [Sphingomonas nostoxanthinifaciens]|uniref:carbon-nitrogen hydrolase family protein n=1 Tax=Sphingomonas nostoxanthinifaciens TaxID=2872652 RepID=UPI001CC21E0B|nr:carbon-nitrogen hydrolase family protein [Sphingomonas nostoxanthinifaciens]UAK26355.1 carbon-nitrogen hydrolase family protein [Sphingomonas nostoxanthinifaciens]
MRAAILQACTGTDPLLGARTLVEAVERAAGEGADMLFTPEMSNLLDRDRARAAAAIVIEAEDVTLAAVREAAARHGLWVHVGSLALRADGAGAPYVNRGFVIDADGAIRARYDKMHLFDVDLPTGESWRESASYVRGSGAVAVDTPWGRLGLAICYDLRFPDLFRALSDAGATILALPAAFTVPTGQAHWHVLLRARAIEAGAFVVAAAQGGHHADGRETYGHSLAVDPWGEVLLDMGDAPGVAVVALDPARIDQVRTRIPVLAHRRPIGAVEITS